MQSVHYRILRSHKDTPHDWNDWNETMHSDKTGCQYVFFIIAGTDEWRLWVGDLVTGTIQEAYECEKDTNGIYIKESVLQDEETL